MSFPAANSSSKYGSPRPSAAHDAGRGSRPEWTRNTHYAAGLVGAVVEIFDLGIARDGLVDLFQPGAARLPPLRMDGFRFGRPFLIGPARNLPFFPALFEVSVKLLAQRLHRFLPALPDHVDLGIVGDNTRSQARCALVDKLWRMLFVKGPSRGGFPVLSASLAAPSLLSLSR